MTARLLSSSAVALLLAPCVLAQETAPQPGAAELEAIQRYAGHWAFTYTVHLSPGEPTVIEGFEVSKPVCGGKWLLTKVNATSMPFEGLAFTGWDAAKQKVVAVWIDSMGASPSMSSGDYDAEKGILTMQGTMQMPDAKLNTRAVTTWNDDNSRVEKIYVAGPDGKEMLGMELECRRVDADAVAKAGATGVVEVSAPGEAADEEMPSPKVDAHDILADYAGNWTAQVTMTMPGMPAADPVPMTQTDTLVCGDLWLHSVAKGAFMGMPYEGQGLVGYDTETDEYVSIWVDGFSPHMVVLRGKSDDDGKSIKYVGSSMGPQGQPVTTTNECTFESEDKWTLHMSSVNKDGSSAGTMTMKYARDKK